MMPLLPKITELAEDPWAGPFWEGLREHRIQIAECAQCGMVRMPPGPFCGSCQAQPLRWRPVAGTGTVHTFTVARQAFHHAVREAGPYVIAVVALDDASGVRLISNIVGVAPDEVHIGQAVEVVWDEVDEDTTLMRFAPRTGSTPAG